VPRNVVGPYIVSNTEERSFPLEEILARHFKLKRTTSVQEMTR
jgi:hypothetical protein